MKFPSETKDQLSRWSPILVIVGGISIGLIVSLLSRKSLLPGGILALLIGSVLVFAIVLKFSRKSLLLWFFIAPFYYFPSYLSSLGWLNDLGDPFWLRTGKDVFVFCIILVWLCRLLMQRKSKIKLALVSVSLLGYIFFGMFRGAASLGNGLIVTFRIYIEYTIFFFISRDAFTDEKQIYSLIKLWILSSIGVSSLGLIEYFIGGQNVFTKSAGQIRVISTLYNPNALGWYLAWANGLIVGLYLTRPYRKVKWVLLLLFGLNSGAIILSGSRGSLLALGFALSLAVVLRPGIRKTVLIALFIIASISLIVLPRTSFGIDTLRVFNFKNVAQPRIDRILETRPYIFNSPWEVIWGHEDIFGEGEGKNISVDSAYLNILYSGGLIGTFLLGVILLGFSLDLRRLYIRSHEYALPLILSSSSLLFIGVIGDFTRAFPTALFFWSSVGITNYLEANTRVNMGTGPLTD